MKELEEGQELTLRTVAMPADTNPAGDIFGGWLMSQMDIAAFVRSSEIAAGRTVTAAVKEMTFVKPVKVGDTVCLYTKALRIGRSSITMEVQAWRRRGPDPREKVTEGIFVMVAVDENGQKRELSLPPLPGQE